jgi:hypothetical protein
MKKIAYVLVAFALGALTMGALPRPRFERIYRQTLDSPTPNYGDTMIFDVLHDRETGQETVCIRRVWDNQSVSCYLTGRTWGADK